MLTTINEELELLVITEWLESLGFSNENLKDKSFKNLEVLDLSCRDIESVPRSIGVLSGLKRLDLSESSIRTLPESICNLTNLESLDLSFNKLINLPYCLTKLAKLKYLNISYNSISGIWDSLSEMKGLEIFWAVENKFDGVPKIMLPEGIKEVWIGSRKEFGATWHV